MARLFLDTLREPGDPLKERFRLWTYRVSSTSSSSSSSSSSSNDDEEEECRKERVEIDLFMRCNKPPNTI